MKYSKVPYNKPKGLPKGYDSKFEYELHQGVLKNWTHHPRDEALKYVVNHTYEPDFVKTVEDIVYIIEAKGRFRDAREASKYVDIVEQLPDNYVFCFLFYNPDTIMPHAKKRKDGTKLTHGEWAYKHGINYFTVDTIPKELV